MFYLINKEKGISSFTAIKEFAKKNNITKIGHTGTLDPMATGLLLVATEDDTKLIEYIDKGFKTYQVAFRLGYESDTYDSTGKINLVSSQEVETEKVLKTLLTFLGKSTQLPPQFSAKKVDGVKGYEAARKGQSIALKPINIEITEINDFQFLGNNEFSFSLTVSRGTYIRSIIHDLGQKLGTGAIMIALTRTKIGALTIQNVGQAINILDLLTIPTIEIDNMKDILLGKAVEVEVGTKDRDYALIYQAEVLGIVKVTKGKAYPSKLLGNKFKKAGF